MVVSLENIGKQYNKQWVLRNFTHTFELGSSYGVSGANGAGKSTLLQMISGVLTPTEGSRSYTINGQNIEETEIPLHINFAAPYIDFIPEMSLQETLNFHFLFKESLIEVAQVPDKLLLAGHESKLIKEFSSGMQQRLKVGLALLTKSAVALLDEPTSNLDEKGIAWYHQLIQEFGQGRIIVIASNVEDDYRFAKEVINVEAFKP